MSMGDLEPGAERLVLVYNGIEVVDDDNAIILLGENSMIEELDLVKIGGKWYFSMTDGAEDTVDIDETIESIEEVEIPVDTK